MPTFTDRTVKFFWIDVENMFESLCGIKINLQKRDVIFYFEKKVMDQSHVFLYYLDNFMYINANGLKENSIYTNLKMK